MKLVQKNITPNSDPTHQAQKTKTTTRKNTNELWQWLRETANEVKPTCKPSQKKKKAEKTQRKRIK